MPRSTSMMRRLGAAGAASSTSKRKKAALSVVPEMERGLKPSNSKASFSLSRGELCRILSGCQRREAFALAARDRLRRNLGPRGPKGARGAARIQKTDRCRDCHHCPCQPPQVLSRQSFNHRSSMNFDELHRIVLHSLQTRRSAPAAHSPHDSASHPRASLVRSPDAGKKARCKLDREWCPRKDLRSSDVPLDSTAEGRARPVQTRRKAVLISRAVLSSRANALHSPARAAHQNAPIPRFVRIRILCPFPVLRHWNDPARRGQFNDRPMKPSAPLSQRRLTELAWEVEPR